MLIIVSVLILITFLSFIIVFLARKSIAVHVIRGQSMTPTLNRGDRVLVKKIRSPRVPDRNEIVVLDTNRMKVNTIVPHRYFVKRVIGLPNDVLRIEGKVVQRVDDSWYQLRDCSTDADIRVELVPQQHIFVMGDGPESLDSTHWGPIPVETVIGKVIAKLPRSLEKSS